MKTNPPYRLKLGASKVRHLSFPDCDVTKMEFFAEAKTLKVFVDGAWLEEEGGGMLGEGYVFFHKWESLTINLYSSITKTYSTLKNTNPDYLKDICEFIFSDSTVCLCGFGVKSGMWLEWKIVNPEMYAEFEPEADL